MHRRLEAMAADETAWPAAARDEVLRLQQRQTNTRAVLTRLQGELEAAVKAREAEAVARAGLQVLLGDTIFVQLLILPATCDGRAPAQAAVQAAEVVLHGGAKGLRRHAGMGGGMHNAAGLEV